MKVFVSKKMIGGILIVLLMSCGNDNIDKTAKEFSLEMGIVTDPDMVIENEGKIIEGQYDYILFSNDKSDSSELTLDYAYYSTKKSLESRSIYQDSVNQIIADFIDAISNMSEERVRKSFSVEMFKESLPLFASFYDELIQDEISKEMFPWALKSSIEINDSFPDYVKLTTSSWSYTGGAHGNGFIVYTLVSKNDGHDLTLGEFFNDLPQLNELAVKVLKKDRELSKDESLSEGGLWITNESDFLTNNFYFENDDLIVYFNQYEIASYADGPIEIRISKNDLKELLK